MLNRGDEAVVAHPPLGVDRGHRAQQHQCLVDEVAAEVAQRATPGGRRTRLGIEPLEPRLEPRQLTQGTAVGKVADGQEVGVPAAVLVRRQR